MARKKATWYIHWCGGSVWRKSRMVGVTNGKARYSNVINVEVSLQGEEDRPVTLTLTVDDAHRLAHKLLFQVEQVEQETES